jgi:hypothetical protein
MMKRLPALTLIAMLAFALAACGQKASTRTSTISPAPVESGPLHPAHGRNAMLAASPSDLHCGSTQPVWVNTHTHVYHKPGDPFYGHTKFGGYICEQDAVRAGYHASKK